MIVKMEVESGKAVSKNQEVNNREGGEPFIEMKGVRASWMFIDDLHDVEVNDISNDFIPADDQFDHFYLNVLREIGNNDRILIKAKRSNGDDVGIACERAAYLLNDNGKTIERLN